MMPFPGGAESISNGTLLFSLGAAIFYLNMIDRPPNLRRTAAKTLAVGFLAVLVVIENGPPLLAAALVACAVGDALLSRDGDRMFLAGLLAFLVGHIVYVALFVASGEGVGLALRPERVAIGFVMLIVCGYLLLRLSVAVPPDMKLPVTVYAVAILGMGLCALAMPGPWIVLGALGFMASDAMLGAEKFLPIENADLRTVLRHAVWVFYYAAQAVLTLGILLGGTTA